VSKQIRFRVRHARRLDRLGGFVCRPPAAVGGGLSNRSYPAEVSIRPWRNFGGAGLGAAIALLAGSAVAAADPAIVSDQPLKVRYEVRDGMPQPVTIHLRSGAAAELTNLRVWATATKGPDGAILPDDLTASVMPESNLLDAVGTGVKINFNPFPFNAGEYSVTLVAEALRPGGEKVVEQLYLSVVRPSPSFSTAPFDGTVVSLERHVPILWPASGEVVFNLSDTSRTVIPSDVLITTQPLVRHDTKVVAHGRISAALEKVPLGYFRFS